MKVEDEQRLREADRARQEALAQLVAAQRDRDAHKDRIDGLEGQLSAARAQAQALKVEIGILVRRNEELRTELALLGTDLSEAHARHRELQTVAQRYEAQMGQILKSRSWRLVSAMSKLKAWLRNSGKS